MRRRQRSPGRAEPSEPSPISFADLERYALRYLERFGSTREKLRRALQRFLRRHRERPGAEALSVRVSELLERYEASGLVDDARFAYSYVLGQRARGVSRRAIVQKLKQRGVAEPIIERVLGDIDREGNEDAELRAALERVRKRRLGPHRPEAEREGRFLKDVAVLARAGFSLRTAYRALGRGRGGEETF
jgi:regulatory protein